jgi:hypothetical protein
MVLFSIAGRHKQSECSVEPEDGLSAHGRSTGGPLVPSGFYGFNINYYGLPAEPGVLVIEGSDNDNYVHITEVPYNGSTLLRIDYAPWHFDQAHPNGFTLRSEMHTLLYSEDMVQTVDYYGGNGRDFFQNESLTTTWAWGDRDHGGTDDNPREPTSGGNDVLIGGLGENHLFGGGGNDILVSNTKYATGLMELSHFNAEFHPSELEPYNDGSYIAELYGEGGDDILIASKAGHTYMSGGSGNDKLYGGGGGSNVMYGGEGDDLLDPGVEDPSNFNDNVMFGFVGADTFVVRTTHDVVADFHRESAYDGDRIIVPWEQFLTLTGGDKIDTVGLLNGTQGNFSGNQLVGSMSLDVVAAADQTSLSQPIDLSMTDILAAIDLPADSDASDVVDVGPLINAAIGNRMETIDADSPTAPYVDAPADIVELVSGFVEAPEQNAPVTWQANPVTTEGNVITAALNNADSAPAAGPTDLALLQPDTAQNAQDLSNEVSSPDSFDPAQVPVTVSDAALSLTVDGPTQDAPVQTQPSVVVPEANVITAALNDAAGAPVTNSVDPALAQVNTAQTAPDLLNAVSSTDLVDSSATQVPVTVSDAVLSQTADATAPDMPVTTQTNIVTTQVDTATAIPPVIQQPVPTTTGAIGTIGLSTTTTSSLLSTQALDTFFAAPVSYRVSFFGR